MNADGSHRSSSEVGAVVVPPSDLALYEIEKPLVEPLLCTLRLTNTALDILFYDVWAFSAAMFKSGSIIDTRVDESAGDGPSADSQPLFNHLDLDALSNPEGSILVVDASSPPNVQRFDDMARFLDYANAASGATLRAVSITGVGSSALGSAAFAWNASRAFGAPVAAIVPGYGLADVVPQALGGWFFGLHDWLQSVTQSALAERCPLAHHSTNSFIPLSLPATDLIEQSMPVCSTLT